MVITLQGHYQALLIVEENNSVPMASKTRRRVQLQRTSARSVRITLLENGFRKHSAGFSLLFLPQKRNLENHEPL